MIPILLVSTSLSSAPYIYPENCKITLEKEEIEALRSPDFLTHFNARAETLHWITEKVVFVPFWAFIHAQAYFVQPCPGKDKELPFWQVAARKTAAFTGCVCTCTPAFHSLLLGMSLRMIEHPYRPLLNYLYTPTANAALPIELSEEKPLHVCAFNVSFTPSSVNIKMDLRKPEVRAEELAESILKDPAPPHIMMIEEGWNEEALKILVTRLTPLYPHILHSVAPQLWGMSSGIALFSMHEIEKVEFRRFENMPVPHNLPSRGILTVHFNTEKGPLCIYGGIHTHSMNDFNSVEARMMQFKQLASVIEEDKKAEADLLQIIMGDLNTTRLDMFGHDNTNQAEGEAWELLHHNFCDLFLKNHDALTGERLSGAPFFLALDNKRMGVHLPEPCASWYDGPFLRDPEKKLALTQIVLEASSRGYEIPTSVTNTIANPTWGTSKWFEVQSAENARFDYILIPYDSSLDGFVEIRRVVMPKGAQSAASDHLPVHGLIWKQKRKEIFK